MRRGRVQKESVQKHGRFTPPCTATASSERRVLYALLSLLRESAAPESDMHRKLVSLMTQLPLRASDTDIAQFLAEEDGEPVDDGT